MSRKGFFEPFSDLKKAGEFTPQQLKEILMLGSAHPDYEEAFPALKNVEVPKSETTIKTKLKGSSITIRSKKQVKLTQQQVLDQHENPPVGQQHSALRFEDMTRITNSQGMVLMFTSKREARKLRDLLVKVYRVSTYVTKGPDHPGRK